MSARPVLLVFKAGMFLVLPPAEEDGFQLSHSSCTRPLFKSIQFFSRWYLERKQLVGSLKTNKMLYSRTINL
jgi:hypothetical protein